MLTDEIMYICIKQNIKYAKVQENRAGGGERERAAATKYVCMHRNPTWGGVGRWA